MNETLGYIEMVERMSERKFDTKNEAKVQSMKLLNLIETRKDELNKMIEDINEEIDMLKKAEESLIDYYSSIEN